MSAADRAFVERFVAGARWVFAKTMPENPHEYAKRAWCDDGEFVRFVELIRAHGWGGRTWTYLDVAGHSYWTMGAPIRSTIIVNRMPVDQVESSHARG